ncbi:hypothetical protein KBA27_02265 [bacterium]|nr:hypothetical protein [bacterium]
MYNRTDILKHLNDFNYFIDENVLNNFIKNWKIDAIYEDDDGVEFFDNLAVVKLKKGIRLKSQGYDTEKIVHYLSNILQDGEEKKEPQQPVVMPKTDFLELNAGKSSDKKLSNFTIDVSSQTLQMIAEAVAQKISVEIKQQFQDEEFIKKIIPENVKAREEELRKDNETLAKQIQELVSDNKQMAEKLNSLEKTYNPLVGFIKWINLKLGIK